MKNDCQTIQNQFADYLTGDLDTGAVEQIRDHTAACASCNRELEELTATWIQLGILPEEQPGSNLRKNFYAMLDTYQEGMDTNTGYSGKLFEKFNFKKLGEWAESLWPRRPVYQFALALVFLFTGLTAGIFFQSQTSPGQEQQLAALNQENKDMRQQLTLSLLNQPSASQRLKGLQQTSFLDDPDGEILETLFNTLNSDANVNVRLSAVDALYLFTGQPGVKEGLLASLQKQTSPLVQVALIDLMVEIREKRAVQSLKKLLENKKVNPEVKKRAQTSIEKLL